MKIVWLGHLALKSAGGKNEMVILPPVEAVEN
jgi:hypothetical protein